jgi:hypothetical protein
MVRVLIELAARMGARMWDGNASRAAPPNTIAPGIAAQLKYLPLEHFLFSGTLSNPSHFTRI